MAGGEGDLRAHAVERLEAAGLRAVAVTAVQKDAPLVVVLGDEAQVRQAKAAHPATPVLKLDPGGGATSADGIATGVDRPEFASLARALLKLGVAERRRRRGAEELRRFSTLIPQMTWVADSSGRIAWYNDRFYAYTGADPERVTRAGGAPDAYHPDEAEAARAAFLDAQARGVGFERELRIRGRDGTWRWFLSRGEPMRDEQGVIVRWFGAHTDISERRAAEEALRVSEAAQRALVEGLPQLVWTCAVDGACDYVSPQWCAYSGRSREELLGHGWAYRVLHPEDRAQFGAYWASVLAGDGRREFAFEYRLKRHDGAWRWFVTRGVAVEGPDGAVVKWVGASTDIHDEVEARRDLQRTADANARELDRLHALSDDLFAVIDLAGRVLTGNPAWERRMGWTAAELAGRELADLLHPGDLASGAAELARLVGGEAPPAVEVRVRTRAERWRWISWTGVREGGRVYVVGRDVTERRRAEEELASAQAALRQAQKMEAIGQLTGGVAHDFNNLLTAITGNLELLQRRLARGRTDVETFAEGALSGARRAATLTQRLLAFSRRQPLAPTATDMNALVIGLEDLLRQSVGEKVRVETRLAPGLPAVWCDRNQLENAVLNLVINARDAMPDGGVVRIATGEEGPAAGLPDGRYVRLTVSDTGAGMTPELAERAFEPFFTTKPIGKGTGLGLSQIYGFATQSGGEARIDPGAGRGAAVSILLPHRPGAAPAAEPEVVLAIGRTGSGQRILVVEDEAPVRELVVRELREAGYTVEEAADAEAGLVRLQTEHAVDLLLTDIGLPGITGRRLAAEARRLRPGLKVLFVTGYEHDAATDAAEPCEDGTDLLPKPFALGELLSRVGALLG